MNQNFNQLQVRFPGLGCWVFILGTVWLLGAIGLSGIVKSIFVLMLFILIAPVLAFFALQFWIKRNLVQGNCPVCEQPLTSLKNLKMPCPNCGTELSVTGEGFERFAADGVIDVQAVDMQAMDTRTGLADASEADPPPTIDVDVQRLPEGDT
ncbi:hypothetical protein BH23CYA1_BH23CYA1_19140 [soil metagenome]|uniref:hypothetical protein n=1 Tax=Leptolyngbya sp. BC1307 TaxID=2029589 RepID=UPI00197DE586|nr:hypothetical protein [Leptolyngbya sp. BC1307]